MRTHTFLLSLVCLALFAAVKLHADEPLEADVVLRGGTIFDGSGGPGVAGDVAIKGDRIVGVGKIALQSAERVIDCAGLSITPGFIDLHTHSDQQVISATHRGCVNYLLQGCTTSVTGNCGAGPVDVGKFYRQIDDAGAGTNVAHLLPQGSLRSQVLGDVDRRPTAEERAKMLELAAAAMRDGAWGMSTGLIYVPSVYADTEELIDIAKVVSAQGGIYASHIRGEGAELLASVDEALRIGDAAKCPVHISHFKSSGFENWGMIRQAAAQIEAARAAGRTVTADQYPYAASSTSLEATLFPTWARSGGADGLLQRIDNPEVAPRLKADVLKALAGTHDGEDVVIARFAPKPEWIGKNVKQLAEEQHKSAFDLAVEIQRLGGAGIVHFSMSEEDVRFAMQLPWVATASDGRSFLPNAERPHPRNYGTFPRKIGRYAIAEGVIPVEQAIRSATGLPAEILGLKDRGLLQAGRAADIVVFDPAGFIDRATFENPHQYAAGVKYVFVNGVPAVHEGVPTGALAGKALRHASAATE